MTCEEIIRELRSMASEKYKANVVKMGIPEQDSIGVSTGDLRRLAKTAGTSCELARELWATGLHEARLLAALLFDRKEISLEEASALMRDVVSWDLCDHLCKNLLIKIGGYERLVGEWVDSEHIYRKRAAFVLMASAAVHEKKLSEETLDNYLSLIEEHSGDGREHVKKAVSWALREIGKRDFRLNEKALRLAYEMKESGDRSRVWIAKDALKELENLVQTEGRGRLISADTKMGREQREKAGQLSAD